MYTTPRESKSKLGSQVKISDVTEPDLPTLAIGQWAAFHKMYGPVEPVHLQPSLETRVRRTVHRSRKVFRSPHTLLRKATVEEEGKEVIVGLAVWHLPSSPVWNVQLRDGPEGISGRERETEEDKESWEGVVEEEWSKMFGGSTYRAEVMMGRPHWYIGPLWVLEEYQGRGIGTALLKEGMDKSDASGEAIYLEASDDGRPVYESLGFKSMTGGKEMVRRSVVQV